MRRVEIPTLRLCKIPGCPRELVDAAERAAGVCEPCGRRATPQANLHAAAQALELAKPLPLPREPGDPTTRAKRSRRPSEVEMVMLRALADGLTDQQIADVTWRSVHTVRGNIRRIRFRLGVASRAEIVPEAYRRGFLP